MKGFVNYSLRCFLAATLAILLLTPATAQDDMSTIRITRTQDRPIRTVFASPGRTGWWAGPESSITKIDGRNAYLAGISGGLVVNHSFSIGVAAMGLLNSPDLTFDDVHPTERVFLYGGYGGLRLEGRLFPHNVVNVAFPVLIGGGAATYSTWGKKRWYPNNGGDYSYAWDGFFVVEPGVTLGINVLRFLRVDIGASYRYIPDLDLPVTDDDMLNGFNATVGLRFGRF